MNSYIKSKVNNQKIIILYYIIISLLTIYATYKNGIILYNHSLISFISIFKPLLIVIISIFIPGIISYLYNKYLKKDNYYIFSDYNLVYFALISLCLPLNISILLYFIIILLLSIINLFIKNNYINNYAIYKLIIVFILYILSIYSYNTLYDLNIETNFNTFDILLGRSIGGIASTNIFLLIIIYLILLLNKAYKSDIPVISFLSYFICLIIYDLIFKNSIILDTKELLLSSFIYGIILIAPMSNYSPMRQISRYIFGVLIGVLSLIFNKLISIQEGIFIAIIISNIIVLIYELIRRKLKI